MALEIVGGAAIGTVFAALYDVVKISLGKTVMQFKPLLGNLKFTLDSLKPRIIQQIGEHNLALGLPNDEIESLQQQMEEGVKLVCKLSKLTMWSCQIWCNCCNCRSTSYTDQLVELDRSLRILLEILKLQEARDVKEALLLARKIHDKQDDLDKRLADLLKVQQEAGDRAQQERNAQESSGSNTQKTVQDQNQGNGVNGATLGVVFGVLFDGVIQVKDKNKVFKRILGYLKSTLDSLKPLIEEIAEDNRVLHLSKKELESFKIQMEKGVELVQNCSKVHQWASYKKYDCTNKLLGLDESLQKLLYILRVQLARDVRESLVSINEVEAVIKKIEERNVGQNDQIVSKASCPIPESPTATAGLDALNVEGSREVIKDTLVGSRKIDERVERFEGSGVVKNQIEIKDSCEVVEPVPAEGINDVIEMLDSSTRDVEAGLKKIKETDVVPVQNHTDIAVSAPQSPTVALDVMNMEAIGVVEPIPPAPECKLPSSTHALDIQFGFSGLTGDSKNKRQEMDKEQDMFTGFPMKLFDSAIQPEMREGSSEIVLLEGSLKGQQQQTQDCNKTSGQAKSNLISDSEGVKHENESDAKRLGPVQQTTGEIIIMQGKETADEITIVGKSQSKSFGLGKGLESIGIVGANARDGKLDGKDRLLWYRDFGKHAWGDFSMAVVQANNVLEDQSQLESGPFGSYVGIYDGHGGTEAAHYVCKNLFKHFQAISRAEGVVTAETIEKAFLQTEAGFTSLVSKLWSTKPNLAAVGTSCLVGVICRKTLLVANLGDSRVVLGKKGNTGEVSAVQLSTEHDAKFEHIRHELQELHPDDPQIVVLKHGVWRVKGIITVSRSIGDVYLKHAEFNKEPLYPKFRLRQPLKRPILSAKPTIISHPLLPNDAFLIFASDGLWEFLSNEKAVEIVHKHPRAGIAKRLARAALQEAAKKREMKYSDLQKIDRGVRRHFHDDITVIVLFLNHELISRGTVQELEAEPKDPVMDYTGCCNPGGFLFSKSS